MEQLINSNKSVEGVKRFWDTNPLFTGEHEGVVGSISFFEQHEKTIIDDIMGGNLDNRFINHLESGRSILDVGCGPGFWVRQFCRMGLEVSACDLSTTAVDLTKNSLGLFDLEANVQEGNAENLPYKDESFDYINCQGVIHHTPDTEKCVSEFYRVLKPGGLACFSVYRRNFVLRTPFLLNTITTIFKWWGIEGLKGRGRENMLQESSAEEIVRLYDGRDNPIGKSYTVDEMLTMIRSNKLFLKKKWFCSFPARAFPFRTPTHLLKFLNNYLGLMVVFLVRKPERGRNI